MIQKIIDITTKEGVQFPFKDKDWIQKFGIYCLITIVPGLAVIPLFILLLIPFVNIVAIILVLLILPFIFIIGLYLQGYTLQIIKNVKNGEKEEAPLHNEIGEKLKLGLIRFVLEFFPALLGFLLLLISIGIIIAGVYTLDNHAEILGIGLIIMGALLTLLALLIHIFILTLVLPSMIYIYLETNSIAKAYNLVNVRKIIKEVWREFLLLYAIAIVGSIIMSFAGQFPCVGIFVTLIGASYIAFVLAFVTGKIFKDIKTKID